MFTRLSAKWMAIVLTLLVTALATGCGGNYGVEIYLPPEPEITGKIYIGGNVTNSGYYPLKDGDTLKTLLQAAGVNSTLDSDSIELYIRPKGNEPQKIDINRAEAWLLESLPEIGEVIAKRIIDYRKINGSFRSIHELTRIEGIGTATFEKIKEFVTVSD